MEGLNMFNGTSTIKHIDVCKIMNMIMNMKDP